MLLPLISPRNCSITIVFLSFVSATAASGQCCNLFVETIAKLLRHHDWVRVSSFIRLSNFFTESLRSSYISFFSPLMNENISSPRISRLEQGRGSCQKDSENIELSFKFFSGRYIYAVCQISTRKLLYTVDFY